MTKNKCHGIQSTTEIGAQPYEHIQAICADFFHVQSNPLPICTRPRVPIKGKRT